MPSPKDMRRAAESLRKLAASDLPEHPPGEEGLRDRLELAIDVLDAGGGTENGPYGRPRSLGVHCLTMRIVRPMPKREDQWVRFGVAVRVQKQRTEPDHHRSLVCRMDEHDRCEDGLALCACPCHPTIESVSSPGSERLAQ